jgi:hypothetical protein
MIPGSIEEARMAKWKLLLTTLPYMVIALGTKLAIEHFLQFEGVVEFSDIGLVLTGGVFLIGFMLAGTMADYKESEKLPAEVACALEAIEETFAQAAASKPAIDLAESRKAVLRAGEAIHDWLFRKIDQRQMYAALDELGVAIQQLEKAGATPLGVRAMNELATLRKLTTRIGVISRTGFLASGYALLETLTIVILGLLVISKFKSMLAEVVLIPFVTLIYVYMIRLIRDIDDPFEYEEGGVKGAAEVELFPVEEYLERLRARTAAASKP